MDNLEFTFEIKDGADRFDLKPAEVDADRAPDHTDDSGPIEGFIIGPSPQGRKWEMKVVSIGNWPEVKTETCYKRVRIPLDGWTKVPYPCAWRRTCNKTWYLSIVYNGAGSDLPGNIEQIIKDCAEIALIPALPLLLAGQVGAAVTAFLEAFKTCLITKGIQEVGKFSAGFDSRKTCGAWQRI